MNRDLHNKQVADHFSNIKDFWWRIYEPSGRCLDPIAHVEVLKRKDAVISFVEDCSASRNLRILDAGCGAGTFARELINRNHLYYGIDISGGMIEAAKETFNKSRIMAAGLKVGSVEKIEFDDGWFDLCLCIGVLQYLKDDEVALRELNRVTKPFGHVIISLPNIASLTNITDPYYYLYRAPLFVRNRLLQLRKAKPELSAEDIGKNLSFRNRRYIYTQLNSLFTRNRFVVREVIPIGYGPLTIWRQNFLRDDSTLRISGFLEHLAVRKGFSLLRAIASRWVILLSKI